MRFTTMWLAAVAATLFFAGSTPVLSQTLPAAALAGQVTSAREGAMEGVLVSAKKPGSTITTTVVTNASGRYQFPVSHLEPGQYTLSIRAVGYELEAPVSAEVAAGKAAAADLQLRPSANLSAQISNAEWMMSMPGTDQEKRFLLNCITCHTLERVVRGKHPASDYPKVLERMGNYVNQSSPLHMQLRKADRLYEERGEARERNRLRQADFLARVNLSSGPSWSYDLKTLPRPKGKATQVVITEYDLPRRTIQPHDVILDDQGIVWYSNFGEQAIGKMDPKTGKVTEFQIPITKPGFPTGELGLDVDKAGNLWFGMMYQAGVAKFDRKTERFQVFPIPPDFNKDMTQINMPAARSSHVDGKVWTQNNGFAVVHRIDLATGKGETFKPFGDPKDGENHNIYDIIADARNNLYFTDFVNEHIGRIDAKTGEMKLFEMPTKGASPRRAKMDSDDRLWIGEYRGNKIAMFDTKTQKFQEWTAPTPWSAPYDVVLDKLGYAWTGSMSTDRVLRLNPKTGEFTEYLMPRATNIRRVFVDDSVPKPVFWVGNNQGASILKVEPLD